MADITFKHFQQFRIAINSLTLCFSFRHYPFKYLGAADFTSCLGPIRQQIISIIDTHFNEGKTPLKIAASVKCSFQNSTETEEFHHYIHSKYFPILHHGEREEVIENIVTSLNKRFDNCSEIKSGA